MFSKRFLTVGILLLGFSRPATADLLDVQECIYAEVSHLVLRSRTRLGLIRRRARGPSYASTYIQRTTAEGAHGGRIRTVRRYRDRKWDTYEEGFSSYPRNNPHGDPRSFPLLLGEDGAAEFGFKIVSDDVLLVPDSKEMNGAINAFNKRAHEIGVEPMIQSYYDPGIVGHVSPNTLLKRFSEDLSYPMAGRGLEGVHDVAFHTFHNFAPNDFIRMLRSKAKYQLEFETWIRAHPKYKTLAKSWRFKKGMKEAKEDLAKKIDVSLGAVRHVVNRIANSKEPDIYMIGARILDQAKTAQKQIDDLGFGFSTWPTDAQIKQLAEAKEEFHRLHQGSEDYSKEVTYSIDSFASAVEKKVDDFKRVFED